ncbi:cytochrome b/b6 domain-containing protein [Shewanella gaetbuli]
MSFRSLWHRLESKLHVLVLVFSVLLVVTSPWILIGRQLSSRSGFWDYFHVYGGVVAAVLAVLFAVKVCLKGQWKQFFPYLVGDFSQLKAEFKGVAKGKLPVSGGKGLFSIIEGIGVVLLVLVSVTGILWYIVDPSDALTWRSYHKLFAQGFIGFLIVHVLLALLHIKDFFD